MTRKKWVEVENNQANMTHPSQTISSQSHNYYSRVVATTTLPFPSGPHTFSLTCCGSVKQTVGAEAVEPEAEAAAVVQVTAAAAANISLQVEKVEEVKEAGQPWAAWTNS